MAVSLACLPEGYEQVTIAQDYCNADAAANFAKGLRLIAASASKGCHRREKTSLAILPGRG